MRYEVTGTTMQTVSIDLAPGESLYSQTASMAWMSPSIRMDTQIRGSLFAGDQTGDGRRGLVSRHANPPGKVWLQSMPIMNLAEEIGRCLPLGNGERGSAGSLLGAGVGVAAVGGILGSIIGDS